MTIELNKAHTIKLNSGEEIVTKIISEDATTYTVEKPLALVHTKDGQSGWVPAITTADFDLSITINKSSCAIIGLTHDEISDSYLETTTGIKPVRKNNKIILG